MALVKKQKKKRIGAATVEMAIVFPLLLLITLGAIRYGWLFLKAQQITNAARMGARTAVLPDADTTQVTTMINNLMTAANINPSDCTITISPSDYYDDSLYDVGTSITVKITIPASKVDIMAVPIFTDIEPSDWKLGASVSMAKEGF